MTPSFMKISKGKSLILLGVVLVVIDQVIKILVKTNMTIGEGFNVIGNWFQILFIENKGMAFGMSFGGSVGKLCLTVFRLALFGVLCWWISSLLKQSSDPSAKNYKKVPTGVLVGLTLVTAGAFGNIIDSTFYGVLFSESTVSDVAVFGGKYAPLFFGKVVDMFYFPLFVWPRWVPFVGGHIFFEPIFNFADSCVTVGAIYLIFFQYKFFASEGKKNKPLDSDVSGERPEKG